MCNYNNMKSFQLCVMALALCVVPMSGFIISAEPRLTSLDSFVDDQPTDHAKVARQIVHNADWTAFGTNSAVKELKGYPMVNVISVADSKRDAASTGNIYYYLTNLDYTAQDLMHDNHLTMLFSLEQSLGCSSQNVDAMEPTCARIMISGQATQLKNGTDEYAFGAAAFLDRHPAVTSWLRTHSFYLCKLDIQSVVVLDWYGGPHVVPVDEYFNVKP